MYGDGIGSLNVYKKYVNENSQIIWNRKGNQDNIWRMGRVSLPASESSTFKNFSIFFEGVRGRNERGFYSIIYHSLIDNIILII